ncbi:NHL repeat-containing protein [Hoeflea sp. WL0058]|uniref:NHL repeat-containing protein n=1 Tax=Flavimaribacter sediminis TaxID=2865987 RepID=A0AAE2ZR91_9HYPH|nr:NHL repeat-containing protein [Flavimaribacter sediminis]MBW8639372.1 NHL repeat-containing protein [Flavimaribacter sediminis]
MMNALRSSLAARALALAVVSASPFVGPTAAFENPATPEKLWDGFSSPVGMAFDAKGNLFVAEWGAGRVSRIDPAGKRTTFADVLSGPSGLTIGPNGTIYVASYSRDEVYRFTPSGERRVHVTGLATPAGLSFDRSGRLLVANRRTNQILSVSRSGGLEPVIGGLRTPVGVVQTPDNGYVVSNIGGGVTILRPDGARIEAGEEFGTPGPGVAMTKDGRVFVVDYGGTTVRKILSDGQSRIVAEGLRSPVGLVVTPDGASLLTATWGDGTIYRIPVPD